MNPFQNGTHIMGIVNVTPDSFSDGGQFNDTDRAINHALQLINEGADIIDIGGESTRPNADVISTDEELSRVIPVIEKLAGETKWISIDTRRAIVMDEAMRAGATMINDVSALEDDPDSLSIAAKYDCPICLMHKKGMPQTMQDNPNYDDVVDEVFNYLQSRIEACLNAGIAKDRLIADVGIGFGKTVTHNIALLKNISKFYDLNVPVLLGASRKSFIEKIMSAETPANQRLGGSLATVMWGLEKDVQIVRVHDVAETKQAMTVYNAIANASL